jgi:hypothetical protein
MSPYLRDISTRRRALLAAFLCVSILRGLAYGALIPPWQAPDEPRHLEYAILLSQKGWFLTRDDLSPDVQGEIITSLLETNFWTLIGRAQPDRPPASFSDDPFLRLSGSSPGHESPLYFVLPALCFKLLPEGDLLTRLYVLRVFSVLLSAAAVCVAGLTAFELFPDDRFLRVAIPAFLAFLPMFTFIGASASDDAFAVLCGSLVTWQLVRVFKRGLSSQSGLVLCGLAILALVAKRTCLFLLPLVLAAAVIYVLWRRVRVRRGLRCAAVVTCMLGLLLLALLLSWRGEDAAGWVALRQPSAPTRICPIARSGEHSLYVEEGRLLQTIPFNTVRALRGKTVTLEVWTRSAKEGRPGSLVVEDDQERSSEHFLADAGWTRHEVTHTVALMARSMRVMLGSSAPGEEAGQGLYFDDLALHEEGQQGPNWLRNGSAETPALRMESRLGSVSRYLTLEQLADARSYDLASLKRYVLYGLLTFAGFWANFGWLTLPLHPLWYSLLAVVTVISASGLALWGAEVLRACRRNGAHALCPRDVILLLFLLGLFLLGLQTALPAIGSQWQPQGRYLFPGLVIIATLFAFGLRRLTRRQEASILTATYVTCLVLFDALCLVGYIVPHYYG